LVLPPFTPGIQEESANKVARRRIELYLLGLPIRLFSDESNKTQIKLN
jgi:hypothetical protein